MRVVSVCALVASRYCDGLELPTERYFALYRILCGREVIKSKKGLKCLDVNGFFAGIEK